MTDKELELNIKRNWKEEWKNMIEVKRTKEFWRRWRNSEIAYLYSDKIGKIIIMDRSEYNDKMREAIIKMGAERIMEDPNEI